MVNEMQKTSKNGLDALVLSERQGLVQRVKEGEFGSLDSFYTPLEQRLVEHAQRVDFYLQRALSAVTCVTAYFPVIHVTDAKATPSEGDEDSAPIDTDSLVLDPGSLVQALRRYSSFSLKTLVKGRVDTRVAEDFFQRKYTQLENAEAACAQNLASLNERIEAYEKKQRTLFDRALEIRKSYDQREIAIAEYEATKRALDEDHESCRFAIQSYSDELLCNAGFESATDGSDSTRERFETNRRLLLVIQQEGYATAHKLQDERSRLIDEKRDLDFLERAATVLTAGLGALYQNRDMIRANQRQVQHHRLEIDQKRVTYETCVEMYQFAVAVPEPEESKALIVSIEQGIGKLQQNYNEKFGLGSSPKDLGGP